MIRVADIQRVVASSYGVTVADLKQSDGVGMRDPIKVRPRHVAMFLARTHCRRRAYADDTHPMSLAQIGHSFGNRDHTTILHAVKRISKERQKNKSLDVLIGVLERRIATVDNSQCSTSCAHSESA